MRGECASNIQNWDLNRSHGFLTKSVQLTCDVEVSSTNVAVNEEAQISWVDIILEVLTVDLSQVVIPLVVNLEEVGINTYLLIIPALHRMLTN